MLYHGTLKGASYNVSGCDLDRLLEEVVFQDNESGVQERYVAHDQFPILKDLSDGCRTARDVEVCSR